MIHSLSSPANSTFSYTQIVSLIKRLQVAFEDRIRGMPFKYEDFPLSRCQLGTFISDDENERPSEALLASCVKAQGGQLMEKP
jgi:hypothetical protein